MNKEENKHIIFEVINNNGDIKLTKLRNPRALWQDKDYPDEYVFKDVDYVNIFNLIQENQELKRNCNIGYENLNFYREENQELKERINGVYEERTYLYNKLSVENEQLNILVNSCQEEIRRLKEQLEESNFKLSNLKMDKIETNNKYKNQQKEFISYLESEIDRLEKTEFYIDSIQKAAIETHKHNLSKYKKIIGVKE